jgi:hypothetical protein
MGYYSDVAIGMAFANREAVTAFLAEVRLNNTISPEDLAHYSITEIVDVMTLLHTNFESVKWYDNYDDVKCHHALLGAAADRGAGTAFVRIGEEYNDITVEIDGGASDQHDLWDLYGVDRRLRAVDHGTSIRDFLNNTQE